MKLILVRHGETVENHNGILQGHLPGTLSSDGIAQANKVALRLKDEKIDVIYSSDLRRASDTAKEIAKYHDISLILDERLRERCWGALDGKSYAEVEGLWLEEPPGSELKAHFAERTARFLDMITAKHSNDSVLVVTHGGIIGQILINLGKIAKKDFETIAIPNASVTLFDPYPELKLISDVKHL